MLARSITLEQRGYLVDVRGSLEFSQHYDRERSHQHNTNQSLSREKPILRLSKHSTLDYRLSKPQLTRSWVEGVLRAVQILTVALGP